MGQHDPSAVGIAIIAWAAVAPAEEPLVQPARQLLWIALVGLVIVALQLVPLPPSVWSHLVDVASRRRLSCSWDCAAAPADLAYAVQIARHLAWDHSRARDLLRDRPAEGLSRAASWPGRWLPERSLEFFSARFRSPAQCRKISPWYLYAETNVGAAVGFFANANHMATLLMITLPFLAALAAAARGANIQRYSAFIALTAGTALVVLVGIALNGSLAAYGLVLPILLASVLIVVRVPRTLKAATMVLVVILFGAASSRLGEARLAALRLARMRRARSSRASKSSKTTFTSAKDYFPWGSGLGSFRQVYAMHEDPTGITPTYVVHAHNDYAELILETGLAGILLLVLFLIWWGAAARRIWTSAEAGPFAKAASIASAAVLAHSLVDFPLRTAAVSAAFGMCLALLADRRSPQVADPTDLRPTRHFVVR